MDFQPFKSFRTQQALKKKRDETSSLHDTSKLEGARQIIETAEEKIESAGTRDQIKEIAHGARNAIIELCKSLEAHDRERIVRLAVNLGIDASGWWRIFGSQKRSKGPSHSL